MSRTHDVRGVDVDPERVAFAAREYAPIDFTQCPEDHLPFPDQSFDNVTSVVVIHFVPDPLLYLRETHRVLKDGGHLLIACKNVPLVRDFFRGLLGRGPSPTNLWVPSKAEMRHLLGQEGFQVEAETWFYDPPFDSWKKLGGACIGVIEQMLSLCRVRRTCGYYVFLARKVARPSS
jgi:ubiquinone/menaquinone biosynthesis C-methylase UbiE